MAEQLDTISFLVWWGTVFWYTRHVVAQPALYRDMYKRVRWAMPPWVLIPVWYTVLALVAVANHVFFTQFDLESVFSTTVLLSLIQLFLGHYWYTVMFRETRVRWAVAVVLAVWGLAVAVTVLFAVAGAWLSFAFYVVYSVWLLYLVALSIRYMTLAAPVRRRIFENETAPKSVTVGGEGWQVPL